MKKRIVAFLMVMCLMIGQWVTVPAEASETTIEKQTWKISMPATVTVGSLITSNTKYHDYDVSFDKRWLIEGDNTVYYPELSSFALVMATDADSELLHLVAKDADGNSVNTEEGYGALQEFLGMEDVAVYRLRQENYPSEYDPEDRTVAIVGHYPVEYQGVSYDLMSVTIQATNTNQTNEWLSNMDVGADSEAYDTMSGEHPQWTDRQMHKGFSVAANRVYDVLQDYEATYLDPDANKSVLLTGHSRGAAIANILGAYYEDDSEFRSYTYTFATPATTTAADADRYQTIFNVLNSNDLVVHVPLEKWGFHRFGVDLTDKGSNYKTKFKKIVGSKYNVAYTKDVKKKLNKLTSDREDVYIIKSNTSHTFGTYTKKSKAEKKYKKVIAQLEKEGFLPYTDVKLTKKKVAGVTTYKVSYTYCTAYALQVMGGLFSTEEDLDDYLTSHPLKAAYYDLALAVGETILNNAFMGCHGQTIYWLITQNNDFGYDADQFMP